MSERDWHEWHRAYDEPGSPLTIRLALVQRRIRDALDAAPPGPIRVVSACAGQGRDLLDVLVDHPRRDDVHAGVFGNVSDDDIRRSIASLPVLCAPGATVIWTRHRKPPDLTPTVRAWFEEAGFDEVAFDAPEEVYVSVGTHRLVAPPTPLEPGIELFSFLPHDTFAD